MKKITAFLLSLCFIISVLFVAPAEAAAYEYTTWKQSDSRWGSIKFGSVGDTISKSGCAVTSIAILMVHSGAVSTDPTVFNPGIFCNWLNANGGFTSQGWLYWGTVSGYTSKFSFHSKVEFDSGMTQTQKINSIASYIQSGYVIVAEVNNGGHYVAIDRVQNGVAYMFDPANRGYDDLFDYSNSGVASVRLFKGPCTGISGSGGDNKPDTDIGALGTGTYVITSSDGVNMRSGPGTSYSKKDTGIPNNASVYVSMVNTNWGYTTYSGVSGWFCLDYAKMTVPDFIGLEVTKPTKLNYIEGESFNSAGMKVYALYSNNTKKEITSGYTVTGFKNTVGSHTVTITYNGKSSIFSITVSAPTTFVTGVYIITSNNGVNLRAEASTQCDILDVVECDTNITVFEIAGNWGKINFNGKIGWVCLDYAKYVKPAMDEISVTATKTCYLLNTAPDARFFLVYENYSDGTKKQVTNFTITGFDKTKTGKQTITVTAGKYSTTFEIEYFETVPMGDTDFSGKVDANDALTVLQRAVSKISDNDFENCYYTECFDVNNDGKITSDDALLTLQFAVKKITSFN